MTAAEQSQGTHEARTFVLRCDEASLLGLLVQGLLRERWPEASVARGMGFTGTNVVFVEELTSGKSIAFFNQAPTRRDMAEIAWSPDCSVLTFEATADELEAALGSLEGGATFISSKLLKTLAPQSDAVRLSPREADVARLLVQGLSNSEIAERLVISPHTVRSHLQAMTTRLEVSNRGKLAVKIREMKLV